MTQRQRERQKLLRKARKFRREILTKQNGKCYHCGCDLIEPILVRKQHKHTKPIRIEGKLYRIATMDHIVRLADGGTNENNLVVSCPDCNKKRDMPFSKATAKPKFCVDCGKSLGKVRRKTRRCPACKKKIWEKWQQMIKDGKLPPPKDEKLTSVLDNPPDEEFWEQK